MGKQPSSLWQYLVIVAIISSVITMAVITLLQDTPESAATEIKNTQSGPTETLIAVDEVPAQAAKSSAPSIEKSEDDGEFYDEWHEERTKRVTLQPGTSENLMAKDLFAASGGMDEDLVCVSSFIKLTWQVLEPFLANDAGLKVHQPIPQGQGRTEHISDEASGSHSMSACSELQLHNTGTEAITIEVRFVGGNTRRRTDLSQSEN